MIRSAWMSWSSVGRRFRFSTAALGGGIRLFTMVYPVSVGWIHPIEQQVSMNILFRFWNNIETSPTWAWDCWVWVSTIEGKIQEILHASLPLNRISFPVHPALISCHFCLISVKPVLLNKHNSRFSSCTTVNSIIICITRQDNRDTYIPVLLSHGKAKIYLYIVNQNLVDGRRNSITVTW